MLFKAGILDAIAAGRVTTAFRWWARPTVRAGGSLRTPAGVLRIDRVVEVDPARITEADARAAGAADRRALLDALAGSEADGRKLMRVDFHREGDDPRAALREALPEGGELAALRARLAGIDKASRTGPWTAAVLRAIARQPGRPAAELADGLGVERAALKRRVRRLKELGLTESLGTGYRLSPRGAAVASAHRGAATPE